MQTEERNTRAEQSRINGAKSHGPSSPEGRQKSSGNALKHGLYAKRPIVLSGEQQEEFDILRDQYFEEWCPQGRRQADIVEKLVANEWQCVRLLTMEKWLVDDMMSQMRDEIVKMFDRTPPPDLRMALAYDRLHKQGSVVGQFQAERHRLVRSNERLTRSLLRLQKEQPPVAGEPETSESQNSGNEPENVTPATVKPVEIPSPAPAEPQNSRNEPEIPPSSAPPNLRREVA